MHLIIHRLLKSMALESRQGVESMESRSTPDCALKSKA